MQARSSPTNSYADATASRHTTDKHGSVARHIHCIADSKHAHIVTTSIKQHGKQAV
jgi:hypothetical protein